LAVIETQNDSFSTLSKSFIQDLLSAIALLLQINLTTEETNRTQALLPEGAVRLDRCSHPVLVVD
jgi:hypothetical protein